MGSANTWVVLKNSSRPTLQDQGQDRKKSVSSGLETKTAVLRTTRLVILCNKNLLICLSVHICLVGLISLMCLIQFVCVGGSMSRMKAVAEFMSTSLCLSLPTGQALVNIASTDRFAIYKVGPVLTVSVRYANSSLRRK